MNFTSNSSLFCSLWCDEIQKWSFGVEDVIENERNVFKGFKNGVMFEYEKDHERWCYPIFRWSFSNMHLRKYHLVVNLTSSMNENTIIEYMSYFKDTSLNTSKYDTVMHLWIVFLQNGMNLKNAKICIISVFPETHL